MNTESTKGMKLSDEQKACIERHFPADGTDKSQLIGKVIAFAQDWRTCEDETQKSREQIKNEIVDEVVGNHISIGNVIHHIFDTHMSTTHALAKQENLVGAAEYRMVKYKPTDSIPETQASTATECVRKYHEWRTSPIDNSKQAQSNQDTTEDISESFGEKKSDEENPELPEGESNDESFGEEIRLD